MKEFRKYSKISTKLLNTIFKRFKEIENFDSIQVLAYNTEYGVQVQVGFLTKKPFGSELSEKFSNKELKKEIKNYLDMLWINNYSLSINTVTKDLWEEKYLPWAEQKWLEDNLD